MKTQAIKIFVVKLLFHPCFYELMDKGIHVQKKAEILNLLAFAVAEKTVTYQCMLKND